MEVSREVTILHDFSFAERILSTAPEIPLMLSSDFFGLFVLNKNKFMRGVIPINIPPKKAKTGGSCSMKRATPYKPKPLPQSRNRVIFFINELLTANWRTQTTYDQCTGNVSLDFERHLSDN